MPFDPKQDFPTYVRNRLQVSRAQQNSMSLVLLVPVAVFGAVAAPLGSILWWVSIVFLAVGVFVVFALVRARRLGVGPLERAILAETLYQKPVTTFITSADAIRRWMALVGINERAGRTPHRDDLGALIVRPSGVHAIVSDRGRVRDLLVIGVDAISDIQAVRTATSHSPYLMLRITFTTAAGPLDLDPYPPTAGNTFAPYEHAAAVTAESMRRVLQLPRTNDGSSPTE